jgi:hypothetical protein
MSLRFGYFIILAGLFIVYLLYPFEYSTETINKESVAILLAIALLSVVSFFLKKERNPGFNKQYFKHSVFFLIGYLIVHFQYYLDYLAGNIRGNDNFIWLNQDIVLKSVFLSTLGLISFLFGYVWNVKKKISNIKIRSFNASYRLVNTNVLLLLSTCFLLLYFFTVNPLYLKGYYGEIGMGTTATYIALMFHISVYAYLIQNMINIKQRRFKNLSFFDYIKEQGFFVLILISIYLISVILSGDRGPIITFGIAYLAGYYYITGKKFSFKNLIFVAVIGAVFISILGVTRSLDKNVRFYQRFKEGVMLTREGNPSVMPFTAELAGSIRTLHSTVYYVPDPHPHTKGIFLFGNLSSAVPFSNSLIRKVFPFMNEYKYKSSASFNTWLVYGSNPPPGSGQGTTCIADLYLDFGVIGVVIGMFLFGLLLRYLENVIYGNNALNMFSLAFSFVYLCDAFYISRSSILLGFRTVVWLYVLLWINNLISEKRCIKSVSSSHH